MNKFLSMFVIAAVLATPLAHAGTNFYAGANWGRTTTSGYGNSWDFGFSGGYRFNRYLDAEGGYESMMGYEIMLWSASVLGRYPLTRHVHLLARLGMAYWTESPVGTYGATGTDPLVGIGMSYRVMHHISLRGEYQVLSNSSGSLGTSLDTLMIGAIFRF
ncbi:MAG: outer membrane beta-barrel protein [Acidiferrobacteraceae bacterium]